MANGIPTGSAPLFLGDFASPLTGVTQKLIGDMAQQYAYKQDKKDKDMAYMLKALDFTTLENATDEMQQKLLNRANEIEDKWSGIYLANDMILNDQQKLELKRDMREYDRMRANIQGNIQKIGHAQSELADPKAFNVYDKSSWQALTDYVQKGDYTKDASQILRPVIDVYGIVDELTTDWKNTNFIETDKSNDYDTGIRTITKSNIPILEQKAQQLVNDPNLQPLLQDPQYRDRVIGAINSKFNAYKFEKKEPEPISQSDIAGYKKNQAVKNLPAEQSAVVNKYGWDIPAEEVPNAMYFNDFAMRVLRHDKNTLETLKTKNRFGFKADSYDIDANGGTTFYSELKDDNGDAKYTHYIPPTNWDDPDMVRNAMTDVLELVPAVMEGKNQPKNIQEIITPNYEVDIKETAPITAIQNVSNALKLDIEEEMSPSKRKDFIANLSTLFPNSKFEISKNYNPRTAHRNIKWDDKTYDLLNKSDVAEIKKRISARYGYNFESGSQSENKYGL